MKLAIPPETVPGTPIPHPELLPKLTLFLHHIQATVFTESKSPCSKTFKVFKN